MRALRTHYADEAEFVRRVDEEQRPQGYRIVAAFEDDGRAVAVAGFRVLRNAVLRRRPVRGRPLHASGGPRPRPRRSAARLVRGGGPPARLPRASPGFGGRSRSARTPTGSTSTSGSGSPVYHFARAAVASRPCPPPPQLSATRPSSSATSRPARGSCRSPAGRCPCSTRASGPSTWRCARGAGMFDVSHMGEIETRGPGAEALLQRLLSNDVTTIAERGRAVLGALPRRRRRARRPLHLPARPRALPDGHERREPREGPGLVPRARRRLRRRGGGRPRRLGDDRRAGPGGARGAGGAGRRRRCPRACAPPSCSWPGVDCLVCGTGYTGEDGAELLVPPDGAAPVWDALAARGVTPGRAGRARHAAARGLLPPLRQRPVRGPQPARGRASAGAASSTRASSAPTRCAGSSPTQTLVPFAFTGPGIPRAGNPVRTEAGAGRGHERFALALSGEGDRDGLRARGGRRPRAPPIEVDVRGTPRAAEVAEKPLYRKAP